MPEPPAGTVTFLFTDLEGSTRMWEQRPRVTMRADFARHDEILRSTIQANDGYLFKTVGDAFHAAFDTTRAALESALAAQKALIREKWPDGPFRVRMAIHTGYAETEGEDYFGPTLNRVKRLLEVGHGGQTLLSRPAYELVRDELPESVSVLDLGLHRLKDLQRPEHVFQLKHPDLPDLFPPLRSLDYFPNNLPHQLTSFIGREREMEIVRERLSSTPLLTITGEGGSGKTRLALQVVADILEEYSDGVWLVELGSLATYESELVPNAVADVFGLSEMPGIPMIQTLTDYLKPRCTLILLDNCEHLLEPCARFASSLLKSCPHLRILATSQSMLRVNGEKLWRLRPMSFPEANVMPPAELNRFDSVKLFIERAVAVQPDFAVTERNAIAVAEICRRLDGIPLAIELAAALTGAFSVEQIAQRLGRRFDLPAIGSQTASPKQYTLRATIDWSYGLISERERRLLRRMSVFAGGCTLEAAEALGDGPETIHLLSQLVARSLVAVESRESGMRYRLLETIREYSAERLQDAGEEQDVRQRHRNYFVHLAEEAEPHLDGARQAEWLGRLDSEHENLRVALNSCCNSNVGTGLRLAGALLKFWQVRGHLSEGREWLSGLLDRAEREPNGMYRRALLAAGILALNQDDYLEAVRHIERSLEIAREMFDKKGIADGLHYLGRIEFARGQDELAAVHFESSLALYEAIADYIGIAMSKNNQGVLALRANNTSAARVLFEESLGNFRKHGRPRSEAAALHNLGEAAYQEGAYPEARSFYEQSMAIERELGHKWGIAVSLHHLGRSELAEGKVASAREAFMESLSLQREVGDRWNLAYLLSDYARLAAAEGVHERAALLIGAARRCWQTIGATMPPFDVTAFERCIERTCSALPIETFRRKTAEGESLDWDHAIEAALNVEPDLGSLLAA